MNVPRGTDSGDLKKLINEAVADLDDAVLGRMLYRKVDGGGRVISFDITVNGHKALVLSFRGGEHPGETANRETAGDTGPARKAGKKVSARRAAGEKGTGAGTASTGKASPAVAVVLDDFGYKNSNFDALGEAGVPLTMAVLPNNPYTSRACDLARENGMEIILHLPMEPRGRKDYLEKNTVMTRMDRDDIGRIVRDDLRSVKGATGVSNHMGSKATADAATVRHVLDEVRRHDLYFLDSLTCSDSRVVTVGEEAGVATLRRDIFIDHVAEMDSIKEQLGKAADIALEKGTAIAIGHDKAVTIRALREMAPALRDRGIRFVTLSEVLELRKNGTGG
jgi:hypothetical protein